jgi:hypothetical protein
MTQRSIQAVSKPEIEVLSILSESVSPTGFLRALVIDREPIGTEREPEAPLIVSEREPKMGAVCEPGRFRWRAATARSRSVRRSWPRVYRQRRTSRPPELPPQSALQVRQSLAQTQRCRI